MKKTLVLVTSRRYLWTVAAALVLAAALASAAVGQTGMRQVLAGRIIVIDPGHGGEDPGFVSREVLEKDLNLALARVLAESLRAAGATVALTRDTDRDYVLPKEQRQGKTHKRSDLDERVRIITGAQPDLVLSLHANATRNMNYSGPEVFYPPDSPGSQALAGSIQEELRKIPGIQKRLAKPGNYYLLQQLEVPAVIIEAGYLSNPAERKKLLTPGHQQALAASITAGLKKYFGLTAASSAMAGNVARVAIVIDDLGYRGSQGTNEILASRLPLTLAVMPNRPDSRELSEEAFSRGFEVIVHLPMEPKSGQPSWLGPGGITSGLSPEEVERQVREALNSVPHAVGVNNHMGSKVTADREIMETVFKVMKEQGLFFLNSLTAPSDVVRQVADAIRLPLVERDVFLDEVNSLPSIKKQLRLLQELALERGTAIAIGHVGPQGKNTARAIRQFIPEMERAGVRLVPLSELVIFKPQEFEGE